MEKERFVVGELVQGESGIMASLAPYLAQADAAAPRSYVDHWGIEHIEQPGEYCSAMTQAMAKDMLFFACSPLGLAKGGEAMKVAADWHEPMALLDHTLMRMSDDLAGGRPVIEFDDELAATLSGAMSDIRERNDLTDFGRTLLDTWAERILYVMLQAFAVKERERMAHVLEKASCHVYDDDGNLWYGISEEGEQKIRLLCRMNQFLLRTLLRLPATENGPFEIADVMTDLDICIDAILEGKEDDFFYRIKCAAAAREFAEADCEES